MSTILTPPKSNIPIGWVMLNGKRAQVQIDSEWLRYLSQGLYERAGGYTSNANLDEISAVALSVDELPSASVLMAEIDELRARIQALEDGVQV